MVHHGVWDYDNPTGPNLLDITVDGRRVKALAQVTKQGFVYVFDRVTGEPVWPIEERPVATDTDLEGEVLAPTQPFPTRPAPFEYQGATLDDLIDFTPEVRRMALEAVEGFRLGPLYTPLSLNGTIFRPSAGGGASWGGGAVDPETGILYIPSRNAHSVMRFREREPGEESNLRYILSRGGAPFIAGGKTPLSGARISFCIFIASNTSTPSPAATCSPSSRRRRTTLPGIGVRTSERPPAALPAAAPLRRELPAAPRPASSR